jgi:hypothetical protein
VVGLEADQSLVTCMMKWLVVTTKKQLELLVPTSLHQELTIILLVFSFYTFVMHSRDVS